MKTESEDYLAVAHRKAKKKLQQERLLARNLMRRASLIFHISLLGTAGFVYRLGTVETGYDFTFTLFCGVFFGVLQWMVREESLKSLPRSIVIPCTDCKGAGFFLTSEVKENQSIVVQCPTCVGCGEHEERLSEDELADVDAAI